VGGAGREQVEAREKEGSPSHPAPLSSAASSRGFVKGAPRVLAWRFPHPPPPPAAPGGRFDADCRAAVRRAMHLALLRPLLLHWLLGFRSWLFAPNARGLLILRATGEAGRGSVAKAEKG
jgi:hypothetical protein